MQKSVDIADIGTNNVGSDVELGGEYDALENVTYL